MPNVRNQAMMDSIKADLQSAKAVWVVDACGLTVKETEELRQAVREAGASMKVYKNTVMRIALKELDAKANNKLEVKGGIMEGSFFDAAQVAAIASLPSKEVLLGQIAGAISGVARGLAVCINGVPSGLARALQQLADQKAA